MSDVTPPLLNRLTTLETELRAAQRSLDGIRRVREPALILPEQPRLAVTCDPASGSYPTSNANVFPIKFVDGDFTATTGQRTLNKTNRQAAAAVQALFPSGNWIPKDTVVSVYQCRGLGSDDAGEWFILDGPRQYFGRLTAAMAAGATVDTNVYTSNDSAQALLATLSVKASPLFLSGTVLDSLTWISFRWDIIEGKFLTDAAACGPED